MHFPFITRFEQWKTNVNASVGMGQVCVVVYFAGKSGDNTDGLGRSQKGEVRWLEEQNISYVAWDIHDFVRGASSLAREQAAPTEELHFEGDLGAKAQAGKEELLSMSCPPPEHQATPWSAEARS
jgi:hypothetical protein